MAKKSSRAESANQSLDQVNYAVLSVKAIVGWAVLIVAVAIGMTIWLLRAFTDGNPDANRNKLDAIRTAGTVVVGTGGAAALLLAARRQRAMEIGLKQKDRDQADVARTFALQERIAAETKAHQEQVAADARMDAAERRITDLYLKAVEQLGSEKAPVRLGGLYALERLAQDNESQRQTIVNVICAYLRMPFESSEPSSDFDGAEPKGEQLNWQQEREVRLAAQRILKVHFRPGVNSEQPDQAYWIDMDIDLTGAVLAELDLSRCRLRNATLQGAMFLGKTSFEYATFTRDARFSGAVFTDYTLFNGATFTGRSAWFEEAEFQGRAIFNGATFDVNTKFDEASFDGSTSFMGATFTRDAIFKSVSFRDKIDFVQAAFKSRTRFDLASFAGRSMFNEVEFSDDTRFNKAIFQENEPPEVKQFLGR